MNIQWSRQARQDLRAIHEFPELDLRETHQENYRIIYAHEADEL
jgi:hypothetical protein